MVLKSLRDRCPIRFAQYGNITARQSRNQIILVLVLVLEKGGGVVLPHVVAQRLEGSRFGACFVALANLFHHEPGPNVRQQAAPGNDPAFASREK
jgi:hypothetical protein